MKNKTRLFTLGMCLTLSGCNLFSKPEAPTPTPTPTPSASASTNIQEIAKSNKTSELPFQLYKLLAIEPKNTNFSPLSLKMAFSLIYPGTREGTQKLFEQIFGFNDSKSDVLKAEYDLATKITTQKVEGQELAFENSAWFRNPKSLKANFKESLKSQNTEVGKLNLDAMNEWASKASHGKIKKMMDHLESRSQAIILNSIYLKQKWKTPFSVEKTTVSSFRASPNLSEKVPMLHDERAVRYFEDDTAKWIALPYENSPLMMYFALPIKHFDLASVDAALSADQFAKIASQMKETSAILALPKFKLTQKQSFKDALYRAGYGDLFEQGNYSGIVEKPRLEISDVIQAACIEITEVGTEATAVSAVTMLEGAARRPIISKSFIADEPFLFVLRNEETKEVYWIGKIFSPVNLH